MKQRHEADKDEQTPVVVLVRLLLLSVCVWRGRGPRAKNSMPLKGEEGVDEPIDVPSRAVREGVAVVDDVAVGVDTGD